MAGCCKNCGVNNNKEVMLIEVKKKLDEVFVRLLNHDGYGHCEVDFRILKRGQKEIIIRCGEEFRYVINV